MKAAFLQRLLRYTLTGGTAAVIDIGMFVLLVPILVSVPVAAVASTLIAMVANYVLSARFAFRTDSSRGRAALFFFGACIGLLINATVTTQVAALDVAPSAVAKLCGTGIAFGFNFLFNHFVVFSDPSLSRR